MKLGNVFALTWVAASAAAWAQGLPIKADPPTGIPFEMNRDFGSILISAQVNGRPATLIVDTGSSRTILSVEVLKVNPHTLENAEGPRQGSGLVGTAAWAKATVEVGTLKWPDRKVLVMDDFQNISNNMKKRVDGILGQDILREFDLVIIDFKHHRLVLRNDCLISFHDVESLSLVWSPANSTVVACLMTNDSCPRETWRRTI